jgi:hypothetical protein
MLTIPLKNSLSNSIYPERKEPRLDKADQLAAAAGGFLAARMRPRAE